MRKLFLIVPLAWALCSCLSIPTVDDSEIMMQVGPASQHDAISAEKIVDVFAANYGYVPRKGVDVKSRAGAGYKAFGYSGGLYTLRVVEPLDYHVSESKNLPYQIALLLGDDNRLFLEFSLPNREKIKGSPIEQLISDVKSAFGNSRVTFHTSTIKSSLSIGD
jgi:hypothetical protein